MNTQGAEEYKIKIVLYIRGKLRSLAFYTLSIPFH